MLKIFAKVLAWLCGIYAALVVLVVLYDAVIFKDRNIDFYQDYRSGIFAHVNHLAVYGLNKVRLHDRQILLMGASVVGRGFIADDLANSLGEGAHVHKLAMAGANISMHEELLHDLAAKQDFTKPQSLTVIIPVHFKAMLDDARKYPSGRTHLGTEKLRHKIWSQDGVGEIVPRFPPAIHTPLYSYLIQPFVRIYGVKSLAHEGAYELKKVVIDRINETAGRQVASINLTDDQYMARTLESFGGEGYTDEQFKKLAALSIWLQELGAQVIILDLPTQTIYREGFPLYHEYREKLRAHLPADAIYIDMSAFAEDAEFEDDIHALPEFMPNWTEELARALAEQKPFKQAPTAQ
tara:strand:+ start:550 stop:1602 length:1053 start_codon:yes stop_codon:yes gene_type:complete